VAYKLSLIFKKDIHTCLVKTLTKEERVILIRSDRFYKRLVRIGLKKSAEESHWLSTFLYID